MAIDIDMELIDGPVPIKGESLDTKSSKKGSFILDSFEIGISQSSDTDSLDDEDEDGDKKPGFKTRSSNPTINMSEQVQQLADYTFTVKKQADACSPFLFKAYSMAIDKQVTPFKKAIITMRKISGTSPEIFMQYTFGHVFVVSYSLEATGSDNNADPDETLTFCFGSWEMSYWKQLSDTSRAGKMDPKAIICQYDFLQRLHN